MNCFTLTLLLYLLPCVICGSTKIHVKYADGYYWRDYAGEIPSDAVSGGSDKEGITTFIGQALHENPNGKLIPGTINAVTKKMYYAWSGDEYSVTKNVKILCSHHPENFEWIETNLLKIQSLDEKNLVVGGYDTSYPLYIGRIHAEGEVVVGKITVPPPYDALGYTVNGKAYFVKTAFEVLSYQTKPDGDGSHSGNATVRIINIHVY